MKIVPSKINFPTESCTLLEEKSILCNAQLTKVLIRRKFAQSISR